MHRRWRVRHSYPRPVVELVELLLTFCSVREICALLDIPASVIYRWRAGRRFAKPAAERWFAHAAAIAGLVARCDAIGFGFMQRLHAAHGPAWESIRATLQAANAHEYHDRGPSADSNEPSSRGTNEAAVEAVERARVASAQDLLESPGWSCPGAPRYVFDARRERAARKVRHRLETARRMIDAEYFLEIDCRTLADAAQMSPHHFIRMFNQLFGSTPHQYLIRTRVEAAKRLLLASREPIEVIATGVGFRSGQSLNRAFKQIEGVSVSRFCHHAGKQPAAATRAMPVRDHLPGAANDAVAPVALAAYAPSTTA